MLTEKQSQMCVCRDKHMKTMLEKYKDCRAWALEKEEMLTPRCLCKLNSAPL